MLGRATGATRDRIRRVLTSAEARKLAQAVVHGKRRRRQARRIPPRLTTVGTEHGSLFASFRGVGPVAVEETRTVGAAVRRFEVLPTRLAAPEDPCCTGATPAQAAEIDAYIRERVTVQLADERRTGWLRRRRRELTPSGAVAAGAYAYDCDDGIVRARLLPDHEEVERARRWAELRPAERWVANPDRGARVIDAHLDYLTIGMRIEPVREMRVALLSAIELSARLGRREVPFRWCDFVGTVKANPRVREAWLSCATFRVLVRLPDYSNELDPPDAPWWEFTWENQALLDLGLADAAPAARRAMHDFGRLQEWRLYRVDLAADVAGFPFQTDELDRVVKHGQAKIGHFAYDKASAYAPDVEYRDNKPLGWVISPGSLRALMVRCYDKRDQMKLLPPERREEIRRRWFRGGWRDEPVVRRLELQARSEFLNSVPGARDPAKLHVMADRIWHYAIGHGKGPDDRGLIRLHLADRTRSGRSTEDPRWAVFRTVRFSLWNVVDHVEPIKRERRRGAVAPEQLIGCVLSTVAVSGELAQALGLATSIEVRRMIRDPAFAETWVRDVMHDVFARSARLVADRMLERFNAAAFADRFLMAAEAKIARFTEWTDPGKPRFEPPERDVLEARAMLARVQDEDHDVPAAA